MSNKNITFTFRVSPEEKELLQRAADLEVLKVSQFVRQTAITTARELIEAKDREVLENAEQS